MAGVSAAEVDARKALDTLEFPRMLCQADGTQVRVDTRAEALAAFDRGLTVLPTAPAPHDGGTPTRPGTPALPQAVQDAIARAVDARADAREADEAAADGTPPLPKRKR